MKQTKQTFSVQKDLNNIINQLDLIDKYRTLYLTTEDYPFFSRANGTSSRKNIFWARKQVSMNLKRMK